MCSGDTHSAPSRHHGVGGPGKRPSGPESPASRPIPLDSCLLRRPHTRVGQGSTRSGVRTAACPPGRPSAWLRARPVPRSGTEDHLGTQDSSYASALVITALSQIRGAEGTSRVSTRNPARHTGPRTPGDAAAEAGFPSRLSVYLTDQFSEIPWIRPCIPIRSLVIYHEMRRRFSAHFFSKLHRTGVKKVSPNSARPKVTRGGSVGLPGGPGWSPALADMRRAGGVLSAPRDAQPRAARAGRPVSVPRAGECTRRRHLLFY